MTTDTEILEWIETGRALQCTHVLLVRRGRVEQHFPIYVRPTERLDERIKAYNGVNEQVVDKVIPL